MILFRKITRCRPIWTWSGNPCVPTTDPLLSKKRNQILCLVERNRLSHNVSQLYDSVCVNYNCYLFTQKNLFCMCDSLYIMLCYVSDLTSNTLCWNQTACLWDASITNQQQCFKWFETDYKLLNISFLAVLLMTTGLVVFPAGFDSVFCRRHCPNTRMFYAGGCHVGWAYMLAIMGTALSMFCPFLSHYTNYKSQHSPTSAA